MIAIAFGYFNHKFSQFKFIDFNEIILYQQEDIFSPKDDVYDVIIFSSNRDSFEKILKLNSNNKILAIDLYQNRFKSSDKVIFTTAGINTLLKIVLKFHISEVPTNFQIKREKNSSYKQNSEIITIKL